MFSLPESADKINDVLISARNEKYALQDKIHWLFNKNDIFSRITACMKAPMSNVYIGRSEKGITSYGNIMKCSNVWLCPICSAKINKKRAVEISKAIGHMYRHEYTVVMVTFTHPHKAGEPLKRLRKVHAEALRKFKSGRVWKGIKENLRYLGCINGNEVTYGLNGWHWHSHMLMFIKNDKWLKDHEDVLKERWIKCIRAAGLTVKKKSDMMDHGMDFIYDCHATDYIAKLGKNWGIEKELICGAGKKERYGKSPFELADGNQKEKELFIEYAKAVSLEDRANQIVWSKGIKSLVGVKDKSDQELNSEKEDHEILGYLAPEDWKLILARKARSKVLEIAEREGFEGVIKWIEDQYLCNDTVA